MEWAAELMGDGAHLVDPSFGGCVALSAASRCSTAQLCLQAQLSFHLSKPDAFFEKAGKFELTFMEFRLSSFLLVSISIKDLF